ncbi:MAG: phosphotransferase, partial [Shimia sp.]
DAPVGYDIARLLVSYVQMVGDLDAIPSGGVVPPAALDAFFEGYTLVPRDDPGVQFMLRVQVLTDWNRMHPRMTAQSLIRHARVKAIARRAFA